MVVLRVYTTTRIPTRDLLLWMDSSLGSTNRNGYDSMPHVDGRIGRTIRKRGDGDEVHNEMLLCKAIQSLAQSGAYRG